MRKLILMTLLGLGIASMACAFNFNASPPESMKIIRTTLTTAETIYPVELLTNEAAVWYDIVARGGDIKWLNTNSTTETNYKTINQDISDYSPTYISIPIATSWYFKSSTSHATLEVQLWYY